MKTTRQIIRLALILAIATLQLYAIHSPSGKFFAKPADYKNAQSLIAHQSFAKASSRPSRNHQYLTPSGNFIIHYDNSDFHAVPQDYTYNDSIPDFVYKAAEYLDASYLTLRDSLGFSSPPIDNASSPEIDVYFKYDMNYYGVTNLENNDGNGAWTSYLTLSTLLGDSSIFYTHGLEGLRVTCAHELFHIFQLGYKYRSSDVFYFEMSSVWFEEYMYPEVNDYHSYVKDYTNYWNYSLNSSSLDYNNVGFNLYLDKRFSSPGHNVIKNIWDRILSVDGLSAIRNELLSRGVSFEEALRDWGTAQVLCGPYSSENFSYAFNDAEELPTISFDNYSNKIMYDLEGDIAITSNPGVFYYKLTNLPDNAFIFDMYLDEGTNANLICLNGENSKVLHFNDTPMVIDGANTTDCILVIGLDAENASGSFAVSELLENQFAGIWPNPLMQNTPLSISYVLLEENQKVDLAIYNLSGQKVYSKSLDESYKQGGIQELSLTPQQLASGLYIIALSTDNSVIAGKFTYIK